MSIYIIIVGVPDDLPIPISRSTVEEIITETLDEADLGTEQQSLTSSVMADTNDSDMAMVLDVTMDQEGSD